MAPNGLEVSRPPSWAGLPSLYASLADRASILPPDACLPEAPPVHCPDPASHPGVVQGLLTQALIPAGSLSAAVPSTSLVGIRTGGADWFLLAGAL
jgi:hypothetical protein